MTENPLYPLVKEIAEGGTVLFCGAGISFNSGIPLAGQIVESSLDLIGLTYEEKEGFLEADLPFEVTMEALLEAGSPDLLFGIFKGLAPNRNHFLIARLAASGLLKAVVTTNFDTLIENAFDSLGVSYQVFFRDGELAEIDWSKPPIPIIKIHGCVNDAGSLAITIRQVSSQVLIKNRRSVIENMFEDGDVARVLFLGYSFSDRFDINPEIASLRRRTAQRVIVVEHNIGQELAVQDLATLLAATSHPLAGYDGLGVQCNTDDLVDFLWLELLADKPPSLNRSKSDWRRQLAAWLDTVRTRLGTGTASYLAGLLFKQAGSYLSSISKMKHVATATSNDALRFTALQTIGDNYRDLGEYDKALPWLGRALSSAFSSQLKRREARALSSIGIVMEDRKKHGEAIACARRAAKLARKTGDLRLEGLAYGNMGIAFKNRKETGDLEKAVRSHKRALEIARRLGDKASEGRTLGNLGITVSDMGKKQEAVQLYDEALAIAKDLRDYRHVGIWLINAGIDHRHLSRSLLQEATEVFGSLGLPHYVAEAKKYLHSSVIEELD